MACAQGNPHDGGARMRHHFFITGTDTGVGKTVLSALLCAALDAVYWKPIQTGTLEGSDRLTVMRLAGIGSDRTLDENRRRIKSGICERMPDAERRAHEMNYCAKAARSK